MNNDHFLKFEALSILGTEMSRDHSPGRVKRELSGIRERRKGRDADERDEDRIVMTVTIKRGMVTKAKAQLTRLNIEWEAGLALGSEEVMAHAYGSRSAMMRLRAKKPTWLLNISRDPGIELCDVSSRNVG
jgi:hypothetical protein